MTVNRLRKDGDEQREVNWEEQSEHGHLAAITNESSDVASGLKDADPDQTFSNKPSEGTCGRKREHLERLWGSQSGLSRTPNSASCRSIASYFIAQESASSSVGDQNSYVSLKSVKRRRRASSEGHDSAECRRRNVNIPEPAPLLKEKARSRSEEPSHSKPDAHGISDIPVFFSPDIGDWRLLNLDPVTYELEQSRRTGLLRASARRYQEISEPHSTCSIL